MITFRSVIVFGVLGSMVRGWSFHESCNSIEQPLQNAMAVAIRRGAEADAEIGKTPRNKHVDVLVKMLFGSDNAKIADAARRLHAIQWLDILSTRRSGAYDVHIYCSTDRITDYVEDGAIVGYLDPDRNNAGVRDRRTMDDCRSENRKGEASTRALTINKGAKEKNGNDNVEQLADTIQLCPWFLRQIAGPPTRYNTPDELVKKAADVKAKGLLEKFVSKVSGEMATPIDSLAGFEHVLLHEMTHSAVAGYSDDAPAKKCYGWKNSAKCQESKNADTLSYFALAVELVLHREYTVNMDGTLQKIT